jgi:peptidoglycan/LPS O-acetylase OafA/YrhL
MTREYLRPLTGARFLAALVVVLYHAAFSFGIQLPLTTWETALLVRGNLSIDFFFLLSGFILSYGYVAKDGSMHGSARAFWVARVARIYPVYLLGLLVDLVPYLVRPHHVHVLVAMGITSPLLLQSWLPLSLPATESWNGPGWSLSNEAFFYLLFPLLLYLLSKYSRRALLIAGVLSWLAIELLPFAVILLGTRGMRYNLSAEWIGVIYYNPVVRLPEFVLGMVVGVLFTRRRGSFYLPAFACDFLLVALTSYLIFVLLELRTFPVASYPLMPLIAPSFLCTMLLLASSRGLTASILGSRLFVALGEMSYGVYILHVPIWECLALLGLPHTLWGWTLLPYLAIVLALSALSYYVVERPTRRWIRSLWSHRQQRAHDVQRLTAVPVSGSVVEPSEASQR